MNKDIAIKVENLSKVYKLYNAPIDRMKEALHPRKKSYHKEFYALNDVSFEIKKGECVGIVGKNGSGKSTILKIITGVLTPTSGQVTVNGRIAALLELGSGFNPEYTGMENIYFQGNLMGMSREEVDLKLDDILKFADIGDFIHQPFKSYSSGMSARLAFAVAIHVDPDILIVDEALSVGDFQFQQKCLRRINEFVESGKTILFVSHDTTSLKIFCDSGVLLQKGNMLMHGDISEVCDYYFGMDVGNIESKSDSNVIGSSGQDINDMQQVSSAKLYGDGKALITHIGLYDKHSNLINQAKQGSEITLKVKFVAKQDLYSALIGIMLKDEKGVGIFGVNSHLISPTKQIDLVSGQEYIYSLSFYLPHLSNKMYAITVAVQSGNTSGYLEHCWGDGLISLNVFTDNFIYNTGMAICLERQNILSELIEEVK